MPSALPDRTVPGGWIGECSKCTAIHLRENTVNVNSFGVWLRPGVFMGSAAERGNTPYRCDEVNRSQVRRTCDGMIFEVPDQEPLLAAWRIGGVAAVRDIMRERKSK
jgi:hypothetical protein